MVSNVITKLVVGWIISQKRGQIAPFETLRMTKISGLAHWQNWRLKWCQNFNPKWQYRCCPRCSLNVARPCPYRLYGSDSKFTDLLSPTDVVLLTSLSPWLAIQHSNLPQSTRLASWAAHFTHLHCWSFWSSSYHGLSLVCSSPPAPPMHKLSFRIHRRSGYGCSGLCHGPFPNICTRLQSQAQFKPHRIHKIRNDCPHQSWSDHPRRTRCSRLRRSSQAPFRHYSGGLGLWTSFPWRCNACE